MFARSYFSHFYSFIMSSSKQPHRDHRNIALSDLLGYMRGFPAAAWVSMLHRLSGALLFILLPAIIWAFDSSVSSELSFEQWVSVFENGLWLLPGWLVRLVVLAVIWSYLHHLLAGLRFLVLDVNHSSVERVMAGRSAKGVLVVSLGFTVALGAKLFGFY